MRAVFGLAAVAALAAPTTPQQGCATPFQACSTEGMGPMTPSFTLPFDVTRFDFTLGTLECIVFTLDAFIDGSTGVENLSGGAGCTNTSTLSSTVRILRPDLSEIVQAVPSQQSVDILGVFDGILDFSGTSGMTHVYQDISAQQVIATSNAADLTMFTGPCGTPGVVTLQVQVVDQSSTSGACGNIAAQFSNLTRWSLQVCYKYSDADVQQYCFGDGTGTACPCGNTGNTCTGCDNSFTTGGARLRLSANSVTSVSNDTAELSVGGMPPTAPGLFFQGDASLGAGTAFGDGLRCVGGMIIRLGSHSAVDGATSFPMLPGDPLISVKGALPAGGGTRYYQVWYRNQAPFCTPDAFNFSNGLKISWSP